MAMEYHAFIREEHITVIVSAKKKELPKCNDIDDNHYK